MKILIFFVLLFCAFVEIEGNKFECDIKVVCSDNDTSLWTEMKEDFDMLRTMPNLSTSTAEELRQKHKFCTDNRLGYLLFNEPLNWSIACIWTNGAKGGCFPSPNNFNPYDYIPRDEWRILITNVRKAAGCPEIAINAAAEVKELHICRERCIDCGFSTGSWLLFDAAIFSMIIAIGLEGVN
uniref:Uncharacterized protein n=1 Tax=Panagrolaimus sp. ES5 TaxID=591445 RepID=A0AC34F1V1_9BILA